MRRFFVHIIESPSSIELLDDRTEGCLLREGLRIAGITNAYNLATDQPTFMNAIHNRFIEAIKNNGMPILHISAHGDKSGFVLTNNTFFPWEKLRSLLIPLNKGLNSLLLLCISSCEGFYGCKMAMGSAPDFPFHGLVGPTARIQLSETAVAYLAFYYRLFNRSSINEAIDAMKVASGNANFDRILATEAQQLWIDEIRKLTPERLKELIEKYGPK